MLAVLYLILCAVFGISLVSMCVPDTGRFFTACSPSKSVVSKLPPILFTAPAGIITGMMVVPMVNYYSVYLMMKAFKDNDTARRASILFTFAVFVILTGFNFTLRLKRLHKVSESGDASKIPSYRSSIANLFYYGLTTLLLTGAATFLMFYTYHISGLVIRDRL